MVVLVVLVLLLLLVVVALWCWSGSATPTMYARCGGSQECGQNLTCDLTCARCKQREGGPCAVSEDCAPTLTCQNWVCRSGEEAEIMPESMPEVGRDKRRPRVQWTDRT